MIKIIVVGKIKEKALKSLIDEYLKKIKHYHNVEMIEIKDDAIIKDHGKTMDNEALRIINKLNSDDYVVLVDLHGREMDSIAFKNFVMDKINRSIKLCFIIAGSLGFADKLRKLKKDSISLSKLTFLHTHTRLILLEQLYRSFKIEHNEEYHK